MNINLMQKIRAFLASAVTVIALTAVVHPMALVSDDSKTEISEELAKTADWYKDAESRMVFFTVIEGLYRDGVPDQAVELIIGNMTKNQIKKNFVFRCKLCHATYEAFALYQRRPKFTGTEGVRAFGAKEYSNDLMKRLAARDSMTSSKAMGEIVKPWIERKMNSLHPDEKEKKRLLEKFVKLAKEGNALINSYTTCQACEAIEAVVKSKTSK